MLSDLCIRRPIFATVLSILIVLAGIVAMRVLPMSQYPNITPPTVTISTQYEGANAQTLARTVAAPIEDQLSGIEGLIYYTTSIRANGEVRIQCAFSVCSMSAPTRTTPCSKSTTACVRPSVAYPSKFAKTALTSASAPMKC